MFLQTDLPVAVPNPLDFLDPGAIALLVSVLLFELVVVVWAFATEKVVPGGVHKRTSARADKLVDSLEGLTDAVEDLTKEVRFKGRD